MSAAAPPTPESAATPAADRSALRLVAAVVIERPTYAGPQPTAGELAEARAEWLLDMLARFPALRFAARKRGEAGTDASGFSGTPDDSEALCRLLLHPDPAVAEAATALVPSVLAAPDSGDEDHPDTAPVAVDGVLEAGTAAPAAKAPQPPGGDPAKRLKYLRRRFEEQQKRARTLAGKLHHAETARDQAQAAVKAERARADELADDLDRTTQQLDFALSDRAEPRVLAELLENVWAAGEPGRAPEDHAGRDPRLRDHDAPVERETRTRFRAAAARARIPIETFLAALRALAAPSADPAAPRPSVQTGTDRELRVTQLGGGTEIGGSCVLVEAGATTILIDAGLRPRAAPGEPVGPREIARLEGRRIDAMVVTHAHNDHGGYVPALLADRRPFPVHTTWETAELLPVMWQDAVRIRQRNSGNGALYGAAAVAAARKSLSWLACNTEHTIGDLTIELFPAGHILGAAGVVVRADGKRVVVTGDISDFRQDTVGGYSLPESARGADLLVMESTCCGQELPDRESGVGRVLAEVRRVWEDGGRVLVPAMSLGRAQEVAAVIRRELPEVPVRLDGLAAQVARTFEQATAGALTPLSIFGDNVRWVNGRRRSQEIRELRSGVVISPSGSLSGGPVIEWARAILPDPRGTVLIPGHTDEEAPGRRLERLREDGDRRFTLDGLHGPEEVTVRARVADMRLSAHADRRGLLEIAREVAANRVHLVHGHPSRQQEFGRLLQEADAEQGRGRGGRSTGPVWGIGREGAQVVL